MDEEIVIFGVLDRDTLVYVFGIVWLIMAVVVTYYRNLEEQKKHQESEQGSTKEKKDPESIEDNMELDFDLFEKEFSRSKIILSHLVSNDSWKTVQDFD